MTLAPIPAFPRRLVYLGTPALAVPPLQALVAAGFDVALVISRVDKRRGRGSETAPSPVKAMALALGIPVSHVVDDALDVGADLAVVVAFGQLIRPHVLAELPMVNLHFSLLPRWRGAAPMERSLLAGDAETGVGLMQLEEGLDTGPLFAEVRTPIEPTDTGDSLRDRLTRLGTNLLVEAFRVGLGKTRPQQGEPVYAAKLSPEDLRIDWAASVGVIDRQVRLGGAWTTAAGKRLKILTARPVSDPLQLGATSSEVAGEVHSRHVGLLRSDAAVSAGDGELHLVTVQPEGKAPMTAKDWLNGAGRAAIGTVLAS